jgi:death-on-curing family protein
MKDINELAVFQTEDGALALRADTKLETIWANLEQIAQLFARDKSVISRHIRNIFLDEELNKESTVAFFATVQKEGMRTVTREIEHFNLDVLLSVGYRVNSKVATKFRQWATKTLKQHIVQGYTINHKQLETNRIKFLQALEDLKILTAQSEQIDTKQVLSLIQAFSSTWLSLDYYDRNQFPEKGTAEQVKVSAIELSKDLQHLKNELIKRGEASPLFAQEKRVGNLAGIVGNVFQTVFGQDAYPSIEEKAAHLLYFIIKNHPFNDGNKRSGAFAFIWFLNKVGYDFRSKINPETLTTLTILIAESKAEDKNRMLGIVLLLLDTRKNVKM